MNQISQFIPNQIKKELTGKRFFKDRLMKVLERTFWQVNGVVKDWTEEMLQDALRYCEPYQSVKARNFYFNKYLSDTKLICYTEK